MNDSNTITVISRSGAGREQGVDNAGDSRRTRVQQRRARRDVDFLQQLQRLGVEEADGGALGEGHPHSAAGTRHVGHADHRVWMDFKLLQWKEGEAVNRRWRGRETGTQSTNHAGGTLKG